MCIIWGINEFNAIGIPFLNTLSSVVGNIAGDTTKAMGLTEKNLEEIRIRKIVKEEIAKS